MTQRFLSISELARASGVSTHTLRYYEAQGILRPAARTPAGHRRYARDDVAWLAFVLRLKETGMPLADIAQYALLRAQGETTLSSRLSMLERHRQRLQLTLHALMTSAQALDDKIRTYEQMIAQAGASRRRKTS